MVTKETLLTEIERYFPQCDTIFVEYGMGQIGSQMAYFTTVEESCREQNVDVDTLVSAINQILI